MTEWDGTERRRPVPLELVIKQNAFFTAALIIMFLVTVWVAITLHDEHVAHCYPPKDKATERICNRTFPFHNHPMKKEGQP